MSGLPTDCQGADYRPAIEWDLFIRDGSNSQSLYSDLQIYKSCK